MFTAGTGSTDWKWTPLLARGSEEGRERIDTPRGTQGLGRDPGNFGRHPTPERCKIGRTRAVCRAPWTDVHEGRPGHTTHRARRLERPRGTKEEEEGVRKGAKNLA
eukprot:scaffold1042_cov345-Pavlova_lutheri.AAC.1